MYVVLRVILWSTGVLDRDNMERHNVRLVYVEQKHKAKENPTQWRVDYLIIEILEIMMQLSCTVVQCDF